MQVWQIILIIIGSLLLLALLIIFAMGRSYFVVAFRRRKDDKDFAKNEDPEIKNSDIRKWFFSQNIEELEIKSFDDLNLKGYFLSSNSNKLAIILHGYRGRYYSSTYQSKIMLENGFDVLLPNNRAHDTSEGSYFTMGPKERRDLLNWINFMISKNPNYQIVLMGISMGGHIVMMTVGEKTLPDNVKCFVDDCGYASLKDELALQFKTKMPKLNENIGYFVGNIYCKIFHKFSFNDNTATSLPYAKIPGLFMHGDSDTFVPYENMKINSNYLNKNIYHEEITFVDTGHNRAINQYEKYKESVINFVNKFIK